MSDEMQSTGWPEKALLSFAFAAAALALYSGAASQTPQPPHYLDR